MLFTKATECGIQLENAIILPTESFAKTQIPANADRITAWAKDNHVNISLEPVNDSDFNCRLGVALDESVPETIITATKKLLKNAEKELIEFINELPDNADKAADEAIVVNEIDKLVKKFIEDIEEIAGKDTLVSIKLFKLREHGCDD